MNNFLPLWIALRYMRSRKSERSVSFFSAVSFVGLTLGVAAIIVVMSVMNGFESEMHDRILGMLPHISVENKTEAENILTTDNWIDYAQAVESDAKIAPFIKNISPYVQQEALINHGGLIKPVRLVGIDPAIAQKNSVLTQFMLTAPLGDLNKDARTLILGSDIGRALGLVVGDQLVLMLPAIENGQLSARYASFDVIGFFDVGADADDLLAFMHIHHVSELKYPNTEAGVNQIDGLQIQIKDVYQVNELSTQLENLFSHNFELHNWQETYGQLFQTVKIEKVLTASMLMLIVLVAAFNTVSSLSLMVTEKHGSLAVLRTMGLNKQDLLWIFFIQGLLISMAGVIAGLAIGIAISWKLEWIILNINNLQLFWVAPLSAELHIKDIVYVGLVALLISVLSASLPAVRASKIQGADAVRYH